MVSLVDLRSQLACHVGTRSLDQNSQTTTSSSRKFHYLVAVLLISFVTVYVVKARQYRTRNSCIS